MARRPPMRTAIADIARDKNPPTRMAANAAACPAKTIAADRYGRSNSAPSADRFPTPPKRTSSKRGGRSLCRPFNPEGSDYFRLVIAVRSADSLTMPAAPHQLEPIATGIDRQ